MPRFPTHHSSTKWWTLTPTLRAGTTDRRRMSAKGNRTAETGTTPFETTKLEGSTSSAPVYAAQHRGHDGGTAQQ